MEYDKEDRPRRQSRDRFTASFNNTARRMHKNGLTKGQMEERKARAQAFVKKQVMAGGRKGIGLRVDEKGNLIVRHLTSEGAYDPDKVTPA